MLPNQDRMEGESRAGNRGANRYRIALEDEEEEESEMSGPAMPRNSGPGIPYYRANRQFDREFKREYRPNSVADRSY